MSQPEHALSEQIEAFRCQFASYGDTGVTLEPVAVEVFDALLMSFVQQARALETGTPLERVIADIDEEVAATQAMANSLERTKTRLRQMETQIASSNVVAFPRRAVQRKARPGDVAAKFSEMFATASDAAQLGDVPVETALSFLAGAHRDRPTFDSPEDCA